MRHPLLPATLLLALAARAAAQHGCWQEHVIDNSAPVVGTDNSITVLWLMSTWS